MAKTGRPKSVNPMDKKVSIRFTQEEYEFLLKYAKQHDLSVTQAIKLCVKERLLTKQQ